MKSAFCVIFASLSYFVNAQALDFEWAKQFGGSDANSNARSITSDPAGNVFTMGTFTGSVDFNPGPGVFALNSGTVLSTFISKLDSSGNFLWAGNMEIAGSSIICDKYGNVYVLGTFGGNVSVDVDPGPGVYDPGLGYWGSTCVVKLNNAGNFIWAKSFIGGGAGPPCYGSSICLDAKQNIYVGGSFGGSTDFDPGPGSTILSSNSQWIPSYLPYPIPTFFICSLDSSGNFRYAKKTGGGGYESGNVSCTPEGETIAYRTLYFGSGTRYSMTYSPKQTYFEKRDINGNLIWTKTLSSALPGSNAEVFWPMATTDRNGNIWVAGYFSGSIDFDPDPGITRNLSTPTDAGLSLFIMKLDMNGNLLHVTQMNLTSGSVTLDEIFTDTAGNCYLGGSFTGTCDFDPGPMADKLTSAASNGFLLKYSEDFNFNGVMLIGENTNSYLMGACFDNFGNFYVTGSFSGSGDFNPGTGNCNLVSKGIQDTYIFKFRGPLIMSMQTQGFKDYIHFFPNPVTGPLYLNTTNEIVHGQCLVVDVNGKIVQEYHDISGKTFKINLSELQPGLYIVKISDDKYNMQTKIIKD